jgi:hypothetical protein
MNRVLHTPGSVTKSRAVESRSQVNERSDGRCLERRHGTGEMPIPISLRPVAGFVPSSRVPWDGSASSEGRFLLGLHTPPIAIEYKYREGKVESTLERELNVPANAVDQASGTLVQLAQLSAKTAW